MTFVFLHVRNKLAGDQAIFPIILVRSLRQQNPKARIVQCTDADTKEVAGVDEVVRVNSDAENLVLFRLECFAGIIEPAMFLDTDMICVRPIDPATTLGSDDVALCARNYDLNKKVQPKGYIDLPEYSQRTYGEVYPYVACTTITKDQRFWIDCHDRLAAMEPKFWKWFGDQEAIRDAARKYRVRLLPEKTYGCLLDRQDEDRDPILIHFKGAKRKKMMLDAAVMAGLATENDIRESYGW